MRAKLRPTIWNPAKLISYSKFFGKPNGTKPALAQQTKLAFSKKAEKSTAVKEDEDSAAVDLKAEELAPVKDEDTDMEDAEDVKQPIAAAKSRKRPVIEDEDETESSEEEPPSKKQRSKEATPKANIKPESVDQKSPSPKKTMKRAASPKVKKENPSSAPPKSSPSPKKRSKPTKTIVDNDEEGEEKTRTSTKQKQVAVKVVKLEEDAGEETDTPSAEEAGSDHDDVDSGSDLDEKPEVVAKAREKVQSTLKSSGKDPYPDWKAGEPVPYAALCTTFSKIEMTTKRLEILAHCSLFLRQVLRLTPGDLLPTILLMINKLAADYSGIELGIGESLIMKAIGESTGRSLKDIKIDQNEIGDLGLVAAKSRSKQPTMFKPKPLTVQAVHKGLMDIAVTEGQGAQGRKVAGIKKLLSSADAHLTGKGGKGVDINKDKGGPSEAKFIVRTLEGKLRLGLADKTVLVALAQAMVIHEVSEEGKKIPSTDQMAKGERILKSVYR